MPPTGPEVEWLQVKYVCDGAVHHFKFKASTTGHSDGVTAVIVDRYLRDQLGIEPIQLFRSPAELVANDDMRGLILEYCVDLWDKGETHSGDCLCFRDHRDQWTCICDE